MSFESSSSDTSLLGPVDKRDSQISISMILWREAGTAVKSSHHQSPDICDIAVSQKSTSMRVPRLLYRLQNSMNRRICYRRMRSMGELFSGFEV